MAQLKCHTKGAGLRSVPMGSVSLNVWRDNLEIEQEQYGSWGNESLHSKDRYKTF